MDFEDFEDEEEVYTYNYALCCNGQCPVCCEQFDAEHVLGTAFKRASKLWKHMKKEHPDEVA